MPKYICEISASRWFYYKEKCCLKFVDRSVFYFCCQIRNGKQTAILAVAVEGAKGKKDAEKNKKDQFYTIYRPNTGLQV